MAGEGGGNELIHQEYEIWERKVYLDDWLWQRLKDKRGGKVEWSFIKPVWIKGHGRKGLAHSFYLLYLFSSPLFSSTHTFIPPSWPCRKLFGLG